MSKLWRNLLGSSISGAVFVAACGIDGLPETSTGTGGTSMGLGGEAGEAGHAASDTGGNSNAGGTSANAGTTNGGQPQTAGAGGAAGADTAETGAGGAAGAGGAGGAGAGNSRKVVWRQTKALVDGDQSQESPLQITTQGTRAYLITWYGDVVRFDRNPKTGLLASPVNLHVGWNTRWVSFDSTESYAYVLTGNRWQGTRMLTTLSVDKGSGDLTEIGTNFPGDLGGEDVAPDQARQIALHPNGKWLYTVVGNDATNDHAKVLRMQIGSDGKLSDPQWADLVSQDRESMLVLSPTADALFTSQHASNTITRFAISPTDGTLTKTGSFVGGLGPHVGAVCVKQGVEHLYFGTYPAADGDLVQGKSGLWDVRFKDGAFEASKQHGAAEHAELAGAWSVAVDAKCEFLFTTGSSFTNSVVSASGISIFRILADGSLDYVGNAPAADGMMPNGLLTMSSDGRFLYSTDEWNGSLTYVYEILPD